MDQNSGKIAGTAARKKLVNVTILEGCLNLILPLCAQIFRYATIELNIQENFLGPLRSSYSGALLYHGPEGHLYFLS